ncbi:MAG: hypothetical protein WA419_17120, partial [Silvibacterium sp.]
ILGDGKWSVNAYESFIGHPDAKSFWTFSRIRVFQQPPLLSPTKNDLATLGAVAIADDLR